MDYNAFYYELNRAGQKNRIDPLIFIDPGLGSKVVQGNIILAVYMGKEAEKRGDLSLFLQRGSGYEYIRDIDKSLWVYEEILMAMIRMNSVPGSYLQDSA